MAGLSGLEVEVAAVPDSSDEDIAGDEGEGFTIAARSVAPGSSPGSSSTLSAPARDLTAGPEQRGKKASGVRQDKHQGAGNPAAPAARLCSSADQCKKHQQCIRGEKHPGLCKIVPPGPERDRLLEERAQERAKRSLPSAAPWPPPPGHCQKSADCVRGFKHPGLCKLRSVHADGTAPRETNGSAGGSTSSSAGGGGVSAGGGSGASPRMAIRGGGGGGSNGQGGSAANGARRSSTGGGSSSGGADVGPGSCAPPGPREPIAWLQCERCSKWRVVAPLYAEQMGKSSRPWYCEANPDRRCARCDAPEDPRANEEDDREVIFTVERLLKERRRGSTVEILVRWLGRARARLCGCVGRSLSARACALTPPPPSVPLSPVPSAQVGPLGR